MYVMYDFVHIDGNYAAREMLSKTAFTLDQHCWPAGWPACMCSVNSTV